MAEAAITFMLENVQKLLVDHLHLVSGAEDELKQLKKELAIMKAFLVESANMRTKGAVFREIESQGKSKNFLPRSLDTKRLGLAKQVKALREKEIIPVFERSKIKFANLQPDPSLTSAQEKRDNAKKIPLLRQDNIVGFEDEAETLINHLKEKWNELEVLSIIGMPGLGKTTLAWKIYRDPNIEYEFPTRIWVYVSQEFNRRDVFLTILKKFTEQDMSSKTDDELVGLVRTYLEKRKFILFMDDVWTPEAWRDIEAALPRSNGLGKVLITSRHETVARQANRKRNPHKLRFLDPEESWELLQLEVFCNLKDCPPGLEMLGKDIAEQCKGVPLAIVVIGGILVEKLSPGGIVMKTEWEKVSASVSAYFTEDKEQRMKNIIELSYNQLSHDLRDCFLYLGIFPEDTEIQAWNLIHLWIAEGFIQQKQEKSLEEVAEDNLKDLINRNLVMVGKTKAEGDVKTCRVHDMIREFCKNEAAIERENLFQEMKKSRGVFHPCVSEIQKQRRLCIHSCIQDFVDGKPKGPHVRSFLCFSKEAITLPLQNITSIPDAFDLLRILDVNPIKFPRFPPKLTKLMHLRYIALSVDNLNALPESVSELWNLQTIRINTMSRTLEIKANIWKMKQLRHLKTKAAITLNKKMNGDAGENLQTLSRLSVQCCTEDLFKRVTNLIKLGIRGPLATLLDGKCLEKLDCLQKLKLVYEADASVTSENRLHALPQPERFPPRLRILELSAMHLDWSHMSTLGKLVTLRVLKLKEKAFMGKLWNASDSSSCSFPSLEFLLIARADLKSWTASSDNFPSLRYLVLKNCEELDEIPFELNKSLEILDLERVSKTAVNSARKIQQEKQQMQGQQSVKRGGFKLIIAPGDEW